MLQGYSCALGFELVWFEDSAHLVYEEEPGKNLDTLVRDVLRFAREAHERRGFFESRDPRKSARSPGGN